MINPIQDAKIHILLRQIEQKCRVFDFIPQFMAWFQIAENFMQQGQTEYGLCGRFFGVVGRAIIGVQII